ncbi:hypothetical protein FOA52_007518 [Chlamydomonas sp. UWO 241]|nr:hypothetical protein FOA52_007518 [Chlamydomonas sp. UWO 241]
MEFDPEEIAARLEELQLEWHRMQKESAPPIIRANKIEIIEWLKSPPAPSWPAAPVIKSAVPMGRGTTPDPAAAEAPPRGGDAEASTSKGNGGGGDDKRPVPGLKRKVVGCKMSKGGAAPLRVSAAVLPSDKPVPNYITWGYLKQNELAPDQGKRMFYTDPSTGETVPDSDDEDDTKPWQTRKGPAIDYGMQGVAREFGQSRDVISALAEALSTTTKAVEGRLDQLVQRQPGDADRQNHEVDDVLDAFFGLFCRRCRVFNCRLHGKVHVRPHEKPRPKPAPAADASPCGAECWRLDERARALMGDAERTQRDEDEEEEAVGGAGSGAGGSRRPGGGGSAAAAGGDAEMADADGEGDGEDEGAARGARGGGASGSGAAAARAAGDAGTSDDGGGAAASDVADEKFASVWDATVFAKAQLIFGTDCCAIARMLGSERSCREVAMRLIANRARGQGIGEASARGASRRKSKHMRKTKKLQFKIGNAKSNVFKKRLSHRDSELWPEYIACNCMGSCSAEYCSCHRDKNFCEKYCACSLRCSNRFRGCACRGQCRTKQCPCLAAGRECDPDLCNNCAPTCDGTAAPGTECLNMKLRLRQHLRAFMGKSTVQGWGAFLQGSCGEDDFLGEYTGDLITQEEADRRGRIYDRMNNSYLFNLNEQWVLDARHRGNKFRFANHSPKPNCKVRLLMVDGDWRVAVYANRSITPNEELFYDYRYDQDVRPDWANQKGDA